MGSAADLIVSGIRVVLKEGWRGHAECDDAVVTHVSTDMTMHARRSLAVNPRTMLMTQNWGVPPFDIVERVRGSRRTVAGTFATSDGRLVREWYVLDGKRGANASIWFDRVPYSLAHLERLVDSIELR